MSRSSVWESAADNRQPKERPCFLAKILMVERGKESLSACLHFSIPSLALRQWFSQEESETGWSMEFTDVGSSLQPKAHCPLLWWTSCRKIQEGVLPLSALSAHCVAQETKGYLPTRHFQQWQSHPSKEGPPHTHLVEQAGRAGLLGFKDTRCLRPPAHPISGQGGQASIHGTSGTSDACVRTQAEASPEGGSFEQTRLDPCCERSPGMTQL